MRKRRVLIACKIFEEEVNHVLQWEQEIIDVQTVWLDVGLHADDALLQDELTSAIDRAKEIGEDNIRILYGQGCLPGIASLAAQKEVSVASANNCLGAFLGDNKLKGLENNHTMVMTPSWVRGWPEAMKKFLGWSEVDFRINLGRYERILVLDAGLATLSDEEILEFFDLVQVPVEVEPLNLDHFHDILMKLLE
jgi:hypothetical protein